jgi:plastocyanin
MSRYYTAMLATAAALLAGCTSGGGDNSTANANAAPAAGASTSTTTPAAAPAATTDSGGAAGAAAATAGTPAPITGKTVSVQMLGDAKGYRFEPASITIKAGDGVKWVNTSGGPHNVTFWSDSVPSGAAAILGKNMPQTTSPMTGPLLLTPNQTYIVSFAGAPPGTYHYYCTPHLALGMKATVTVQ